MATDIMDAGELSHVATLASNSMRYTLVPRLSTLLLVNDWGRLLQVCNALRLNLDNHTAVEVTVAGRKVTLYRWGMAENTVPRFYISLPKTNISNSYGWKGSTTGITNWYKIRYVRRTRPQMA